MPSTTVGFSSQKIARPQRTPTDGRAGKGKKMQMIEELRCRKVQCAQDEKPGSMFMVPFRGDEYTGIGIWRGRKGCRRTAVEITHLLAIIDLSNV